MNKKKKAHQRKARIESPRYTFEDIERIMKDENISYGQAVAKYYPPENKRERTVTKEYIR